jgi:phosphopantothenoylcysteine decarboxylase/phosphopantothenate--cysteine ligase
VRLLTKQGAEVRCVLTPEAQRFVSPLVLSTLSGFPALSSYTSEKEGAEVWNSHVELGLWADVFLIAPLTAGTLSKMAVGLSDNLLLATYLSARCPVLVAPAMDLDMYAHPSVKRNIEVLFGDGVKVIPAQTGSLASGLEGQGRMPEPEHLFELVRGSLVEANLKGLKVLVNAGPTYEPIDPVRFIGNHSSGKMGLELASEAARRGAEVYFVHGPMHLKLPEGLFARVVAVQTAEQMNEACREIFTFCDAAILSAAVADFRPAELQTKKIKKELDFRSIALEPTADVLAGLGQIKNSKQILVGFALETDQPEQNALKKLEKKNLDWIVLNQPGPETGFGSDTNRATLISRNGEKRDSGLVSKSDLAALILDAVFS